ncbi:MAG: hypothetical protein MUF38_05785 [Anaerolineae bacterium]|jgi:hypothetical protein|nr:hypothetical protein [Anaerolineae bacterium]
MASKGGNLTLFDSERTVADMDYEVVSPLVEKFLAEHRATLEAQRALFVSGEAGVTEKHTFNFKLPGGGYLERRGRDARTTTSKPHGGWSVSFPLYDFGKDWAANDIDLAYMTGPAFRRALENKTIEDRNTMRWEILYALFNNTTRTFIDSTLDGLSLSVYPLANGDATLYPPLIGENNEATHNHYLVSGYAAADISNTNNPLPVLRDHLEEHFGTPTGYGNVVVMYGKDHADKIAALAGFKEVEDRFIRSGANTDVPTGLPSAPGRIAGRSNGVWCVEWRHLPDNYLVAVDLGQPGPLTIRYDPAFTRIPRGLHIVPGPYAHSPFQGASYRHRYGMGASNRLNAVIMELTTDPTYSIPQGFE